MSRIILNRRQFLRGAGGLALALPFLESLATKGQARAAAVAPPKRFVALVAGNGYMETVYYPSVEADIKFADNTYYKSLGDIPGPLSEALGSGYDSLRPKMNILRGLDLAGSFGHSPTNALCSARRAVGGDNNPIDPVGTSRSIDVVLGMSKNFYPNTPRFKALRAYEPGGGLMSIDRDSAGKTIQIPHNLWPADIFQQVFAGSNLDPSGAIALQSKRATIGDLVLGSYKSLINDSRISLSDRGLVSNFVAQVQDLNKRILATQPTCKAPSIPPSRTVYYSDLSDSERTALTLQFVDIMVAALACDLTRVAIISFGSDNVRHGLSHESYRDRGVQLRFIDILNKYQNGVVQAFASKMDAVVESNGKTMLDNSILFWGMEQSAGAAHANVSMPAITFGSMGGAIKTGYYMDYRLRPNSYYADRSDIFPPFGTQNYNQLMNTIFQGMGVPPSEYEQYGDGGGYGSFDGNTTALQYLGTQYAGLEAKRKNTLPFISLV